MAALFRNKMKKLAAGLTAAALAVSAMAVPVLADIDPRIIELDSGAEKGPGFQSVRIPFSTEKGDFELIAYGLKEGNTSAVLNALSENFDPESVSPLRLVDHAFSDAEKYDADDDGFDGDSGMCWAASTCNLLWMSGWAERFGFASEDELFALYTQKFMNKGCDRISSAVDWFFMGEFFNVPYSSVTALRDPDENDGFLKSFVSSRMQKRFDLQRDPMRIDELQHCDWSTEGAALYEAGIGTLTDGKVTGSQHAVTAAGVIVDPAAESIPEKYKAILIIDSDNNGYPTEEEAKITDPTPEFKREAREKRPNSMTVYNLRYTLDSVGTPYWMLEGYGTDSEEYTDIWGLFNLSMLPAANDAFVSESTETEGTLSVFSNVDLTLEALFTTDRAEPYTDLLNKDPEDLAVREFASGTPVNLNFFIGNRSNLVFDEAYRQGRDLTASWSVIRDADGTVAAEGQKICNLEIYNNLEYGYLINLNEKDGACEAWEPGEYTAFLELNKDHSIPEAYYLNNVRKEFHFTITERQPEKDISGAAVKLAGAPFTFTGRAIRPEISYVKLDGIKLEKDSDYTVSWKKNKNVGTGQVIITGTGQYTGTVTKTFKLRPKNTSSASVEAGKKSFTVSWKKQAERMASSRITAYQIRFSQDPSFASGKRYRTVYGYKNLSKKVTGLKAGKTYYVQIRTLKKIGDEKFYSVWSDVKKVKIK